MDCASAACSDRTKADSSTPTRRIVVMAVEKAFWSQNSVRGLPSIQATALPSSRRPSRQRLSGSRLSQRIAWKSVKASPNMSEWPSPPSETAEVSIVFRMGRRTGSAAGAVGHPEKE